MEGKKNDGGKLRWGLMPWAQVEDVVRMLMHGAEKYNADNWQKVLRGPDGEMRYYEAMERHLKQWFRAHRGATDPDTGQPFTHIDPDSDLPHLASLICSALFLMWGDDNSGPASQCDSCGRRDTGCGGRQWLVTQCKQYRRVGPKPGETCGTCGAQPCPLGRNPSCTCDNWRPII